MMTNYYFLGPKQQPVGPMPLTAIKDLHAAGMITDESMVAAEGASTWMAYREILSSAENLPTALPAIPGNQRADSRSAQTDPVEIPYRARIVTNVLQVVTLGLYSFYLLATFAAPISSLTGRPRLGFGIILFLSFMTLGIFALIYLVILAFDIDRYSATRKTEGRRRDLGATVLALTVISVVGAFASAGMAFIASFAAGVWSVWMVQAELNLYATNGSED